MVDYLPLIFITFTLIGSFLLYRIRKKRIEAEKIIYKGMVYHEINSIFSYALALPFCTIALSFLLVLLGEDEFLIQESLLLLLFFIPGVILLRIFHNHRIYYDEKKVVVYNLLGIKKELPWNNIHKVKFDPIYSGMLYLYYEENKKVAISILLTSFLFFRNKLKHKSKVALPQSLLYYQGNKFSS